MKVPRWFLFGYAGTAMYFPLILIAKDAVNPEKVINHEKIHRMQIIECLIIPFYIVYVVNYLINLIRFKNHSKAYREIIFEKEAYANDDNLNYLKNRKWFNYLS